MSLKDFKVISKLGEGAYSSVYKVKRVEDNQEYALKKVTLGKLSDKEKQNALNEVRILASLRHPYIITYKEAFIDQSSNSLCIVMELADNGDLYQKMQKHIKAGTYFKEAEIMKTIYQISSALKALHEFKILHRDLKSANVFIEQNGDIKLGDMNVSKVAKQGLLYTQTGTPYYASPEVWKDLPYDQKSDIWSLGCVIYEMASLKPPFKADDMEGLYKKVIRGLYPRIPSHYSQDLSNIIRLMLQTQVSLRATSQMLIDLPNFNKYRQNQPEPEEQSKLLRTILFPKNQNFLKDVLPKSNYHVPKQKTEAAVGGVETYSKKRHPTQGTSHQASPNPTRISQHIPQNDPEYLLVHHSQQNPKEKLRKKVHNISDKSVITKLLNEYQREVLKAREESRPRNRRQSQEDSSNSKKSQFALLPPLDELSPIKYPQRNQRNASMPNTNLPIII